MSRPDPIGKVPSVLFYLLKVPKVCQRVTKITVTCLTNKPKITFVYPDTYKQMQTLMERVFIGIYRTRE